MPLLDHFRPLLSVTHPWKGFHSAWANAITSQLNEMLPEGYYAIPEVPLGNQVEIDVATLQKGGKEQEPNGRIATQVWAPPKALLSAVIDFSRVQSVAVQIFQDSGGPELRAAIELVSPANKDRPRSRLTFAAKCVGYLERSVSVIVIDTVTNRQANLHAEIVQALEAGPGFAWQAASSLYAVAYRTAVFPDAARVQAWPETLAIGQELPTLPLWLSPELCLELPLEPTYAAACNSLRISR
jgi:hypothetical protein